MKVSLAHMDRLGRTLNRKVSTPKIWKGERDTGPIVSLMHSAILADTAAGVDVNGRPFAPYSKAYAERTGKTRVTLKDSGAMVAGLINDVRSISGDVVANTARAGVHTYGSRARGIPARPWLGIASKTATAALKEADRRVVANMRASFAARSGSRALGAARGSTRGAL